MNDLKISDKEIREYYDCIKKIKKLPIKELQELFYLNDKTSKNKFIESFVYYVFIYAYSIYSYFVKQNDIEYKLMDFIQDSNLMLVESVYGYKYNNYNIFCMYLYKKMCGKLRRKILKLNKSKCVKVYDYSFFRNNNFELSGDMIIFDDLQTLIDKNMSPFVKKIDNEVEDFDDEFMALSIGYNEFEDDLIEKLLPCNCQKVVHDCLECLNDRNREIISRIYGLGDIEKESQSEIARSMGCSRQEIFASKDRSLRMIIQKKQDLLEEYKRYR